MHIMYELTDYIIHSVAKFYGITTDELKYGNRGRRFSEPRHVAAYCLRSFTALSFPKIAEILGNKTHRTIIYAVDKVDDWRKNPILNKKAAECIMYVLNHKE